MPDLDFRPFRKQAFDDDQEADFVLRLQLLASRLFFGDEMMHGGQDRWDLAIHNTPDERRIRALVVVDQNVAEVVHLVHRFQFATNTSRGSWHQHWRDLLWYIVLNKVQDGGRPTAAKNPDDFLPHGGG